MTIIAAADGSALGNPGPAGWAWFVDEERWASGGWANGTNNMGELMAVLDLLQQTAHLDEPLQVLCDSQYVINSLTKWLPGWKRKGWRKGDGKPVMNVELMKALDRALTGRKVTFEWVKGHAGHPLNEAADERARAAATAYQSGREPDPGPGWDGSSTDHPDVRPGQVEQADDLFSAFDLVGEPVTPEETVVALERELLTDACRADPSAVAALLAPDWYEVGASGRLWSREELLAEIGPLRGPVALEVVSTSRPADEQVLLLWRAVPQDGPSTLRTSLWARRGNAYRQIFHQATAES
ncbi:RNase H family protein [Propionibacteriaceae bacterium Y2011]|uniref:RNase H family protein n=1 Tax=Microlunatus sp. Y2014 TaxID=3418488 RepID=UPI003B4E2B53